VLGGPAVYMYEIAVLIPVRFGAHPISRTIRIAAYFDFKLDTIKFSGKHLFCLPIAGNVVSFLPCLA
jgi:hypothetical protein